MLHPVGFTSLLEILQDFDFVLIHGKDKRSILLIAKSQLLVELLKHLISRPAKLGMKAAGLVVVPGVNDALSKVAVGYQAYNCKSHFRCDIIINASLSLPLSLSLSQASNCKSHFRCDKCISLNINAGGLTYRVAFRGSLADVVSCFENEHRQLVLGQLPGDRTANASRPDDHDVVFLPFAILARIVPCLAPRTGIGGRVVGATRTVLGIKRSLAVFDIDPMPSPIDTFLTMLLGMANGGRLEVTVGGHGCERFVWFVGVLMTALLVAEDLCIARRARAAASTDRRTDRPRPALHSFSSSKQEQDAGHVRSSSEEGNRATGFPTTSLCC